MRKIVRSREPHCKLLSKNVEIEIKSQFVCSGEREKVSTMPTAVTRILGDLKSFGGLQGKDIANIVDVSTATVSRWTNGNATPDLRTQTVIADLRYVVDRLSDYYTPDEARLWLRAYGMDLHRYQL